jgi:inorganic pyrophosphatase
LNLSVNWRRGRRFGVSAIGLDIVFPFGKMSTESDQPHPEQFAFDPRFGACVLKSVLPTGAPVSARLRIRALTARRRWRSAGCSCARDSPAFPGCTFLRAWSGSWKRRREHGKTERNDRLIAVAAKSAVHRSIHELRDLSADLVDQIELFSSPVTAQRARPSSRSFGSDRAEALVEKASVNKKR